MALMTKSAIPVFSSIVVVVIIWAIFEVAALIRSHLPDHDAPRPAGYGAEESSQIAAVGPNARIAGVYIAMVFVPLFDLLTSGTPADQNEREMAILIFVASTVPAVSCVANATGFLSSAVTTTLVAAAAIASATHLWTRVGIGRGDAGYFYGEDYFAAMTVALSSGLTAAVIGAGGGALIRRRWISRRPPRLGRRTRHRVAL